MSWSRLPARVPGPAHLADWTDEIHTVYPDGVGVRKIVVHTSLPDAKREWHEGIVVMGPGTTPNDARAPVGLTLANSRGQSVDVSWEEATLPFGPEQPEPSSIRSPAPARATSLLRPHVTIAGFVSFNLLLDGSSLPWSLRIVSPDQADIVTCLLNEADLRLGLPR